MNTTFTNSDLSWYETWVGPLLATIPPSFKEAGFNLKFGKLAASIEGGGKRRIFAIGNYVKQRYLRPYHDWAMGVLRRLPCDGTFDQEKPLRPTVDEV